MNEKDDIILEYLDKISPAGEPPVTIHFNINRCAEELDLEKRTGQFHLQTLRNRIYKLEDMGLIKTVRETGNYRAISSDGQAYLRGELDASELDQEERG